MLCRIKCKKYDLKYNIEFWREWNSIVGQYGDGRRSRETLKVRNFISMELRGLFGKPVNLFSHLIIFCLSLCLQC